jgi:hypothetical protein
MDPTIVLSLLLLLCAGFMHARLLRRRLREERARLDEARLALGAARRRADEVELARRGAVRQLDRQTVDNAELERQVELLEAQYAEMKRRPARRYHVIDRQPSRGLPVWEVSVRARPGAPVAEIVAPSWLAGRTYLVAALTAQEASVRCSSKFPPPSGFDIGTPVPSQALAAAPNRFTRPAAGADADPPGYVPPEAEADPARGPAPEIGAAAAAD